LSRAAKAVLLVGLLVAIGLCVRILARGQASAWIPVWSPATARFVFRSLTIVLGLCAWFTSQALISARGCREGSIGDAVHDWTAPLNRRLRQHPGAANALLVISSAFIDLFALFLLASALFGPSLRPGIALLLLFAFRQVSQLTCALPTPPGMIWRHPGVPSLLVTYDVANDFFFSGHTAIAVLGAIEIAKIAPSWVGFLAALVASFEALTVLALRAHYTMDVLTAVVAAFCAAGLASMVCVGF
jgi:PAP2 superfamily protein